MGSDDSRHATSSRPFSECHGGSLGSAKGARSVSLRRLGQEVPFHLGLGHGGGGFRQGSGFGRVCPDGW